MCYTIKFSINNRLKNIKGGVGMVCVPIHMAMVACFYLSYYYSPVTFCFLPLIFARA